MLEMTRTSYEHCAVLIDHCAGLLLLYANYRMNAKIRFIVLFVFAYTPLFAIHTAPASGINLDGMEKRYSLSTPRSSYVAL
ncbi:hypothetical protein PRIPAC_80453, partial [Pristionchus pacificus]|uniref:Uncharacterized protein n=1 Tax=Pristionchus pacificus TaxID=54126 RepID=A0A2A6CNQ4_PRIPA